MYFFFFFNDTATTEIYTLSLHDALPICGQLPRLGHARLLRRRGGRGGASGHHRGPGPPGSRRPQAFRRGRGHVRRDRKSTRLNSSHSQISYAVFCLKKKNNIATLYSSILTFLARAPSVLYHVLVTFSGSQLVYFTQTQPEHHLAT